jgi:two-component system cell cycle sensor histidine kinase/response regulator CckA
MKSEMGRSAGFAANINQRISTFLSQIGAYVNVASGSDDEIDKLADHCRQMAKEIQNLLDRKNPDELFAGIAEAAKNMNVMVTDLLNLSKPIILPDIPASLKKCADSTIGIFKGWRKVGEKKIKLEVKCPGDDMVMRFDEGKLRQALLNLLSNAADAVSEGGRISISFTKEKLEKVFQSDFGTVPAGEYLKIEVSDNGPGIPPEMLPKIFEFGRSSKQEKRGSGIGLSIVKKAVEGHEGYITVSTRYQVENSGTVFTIYLPFLPSF